MHQLEHPTNHKKAMVRVYFELTQDNEGYPPFRTETLWAAPVGKDLYEIDNIPFYISEISYGDIVSAQEEDNQLHFRSLVVPSGNSTLRLIFFDAAARQPLIDWFTAIDCSTESHPPLTAVNIPKSASYTKIISYVAASDHIEKWDYQEAVISETHRIQLDSGYP